MDKYRDSSGEFVYFEGVILNYCNSIDREPPVHANIRIYADNIHNSDIDCCWKW